MDGQAPVTSACVYKCMLPFAGLDHKMCLHENTPHLLYGPLTENPTTPSVRLCPARTRN